MSLDFVARHRELQKSLEKMHKAMPDTMKSFGELRQSAIAEGKLSTKIKELMALAIAITSQCDGCISFHVNDALAAGATSDEVEETIEVAIMMGGGPAAVYGADAFEALTQFTQHGPE